MFNQALILASIVVLLSTSVYARSDRPVSFCGDNFPPYLMQSKTSGGEPHGLVVDYAKTVFEKLERQVTFTIMPWARCEKLLQSGDFDATGLIRKSERRAEFLDFTSPILSRSIRVFFKKGRFTEKPDWQAIEDLQPYVFVSGRGYSTTNELIEKGMEVETVTGQKQAYDMVLRGRADLLTDFITTHEEMTKTHPEFAGKFDFFEKPYRQSQYHMGFSKRTVVKGMLSEINAVIEALHASGGIDQRLADSR